MTDPVEQPAAETPSGGVAPEVVVVSLGGTIAMTAGEGGGVAPRLDGDDLVAAVPGLADVAAVRAIAFRRLPGAHLGLDDVIELAALLDRELAEGGAVGAVVTQGTDTIEETAFALDLLVEHEAPVVVTGAMRNPTLPSADGAANLLAAVRVASDPAARGLGTLVVLNDEVHAASRVRKRHTANVAAFGSDVGPLGWLAEDRVRIALRPPERVRLGLGPRAGGEVDVALVTATFADSGATLLGLERRVDGVVVEALGAGHLPVGMLDDVSRLVKSMPVVLTSRVGSGEVLRDTYDFPGSERDLLARGVINGGWLDGRKARVLTLLALASGHDAAALAAAFARFGGGTEDVLQ